jgi:hypothetical protein
MAGVRIMPYRAIKGPIEDFSKTGEKNQEKSKNSRSLYGQLALIGDSRIRRLSLVAHDALMIVWARSRRNHHHF